MSNTVGIIGAGLIGRSWAIVFVRAGWRVKLFDPSAEALSNAPVAVEAGLRDLQSHGLFDGDLSAAQGLISTHADLAEAVAGADYIQENGPEQLAQKRALFAELDAAADAEAIIATSSSGLKISTVADHCAGRERCLVAHPINPPHLVPCVELSPAEWTRSDVTARTRAIMTEVGQSRMLVKREIDGFIVNRLQGALLNEALRLAQAGYADPEDIDICIKDGLGLRWSFMGPFETIDLNAPAGIGDYAARFGSMYAAMAEQQGQAPHWSGAEIDAIESARREALELSDLERRSAWRNARLVALAAHKKRAAEQD